MIYLTGTGGRIVYSLFTQSNCIIPSKCCTTVRSKAVCLCLGAVPRNQVSLEPQMRRTCYRQHGPQQKEAFGWREKHGNQRTIPQEVSSLFLTSCMGIIHHHIFQQLTPKESSHKFEVSPIYLKETGDMLSWSPPSSSHYQCKSSCTDGKNTCPVSCLLGWSVVNSLSH